MKRNRTFRIEDDLWNRLAADAEGEERSVSFIIIRILKAHYDGSTETGVSEDVQQADSAA